MRMLRRIALISFFAHCLSQGPAVAEELFQNKTVTIIVGFSVGGTYDEQARLFARHMGKFLPGNPTVVVQNMPGAGSIIATNYLFNVAPRDGTVLGVVGGGTVLEPLIGDSQAKYDAQRFIWIGGRSRDDFLCLVNSSTGVKTIADLKTRQVIVGATGPGSRTLTYPRALNDLLGTRFKIISGFPGGNEISVAMQRNEVEGYCGWSLDSLNSRAPNLIPDGTVRVLTQFVIGRANALPDIPIASDLPPTELGRRAIEFISADSILAWPLIAPPGVSADRVGALDRAFDAMTKDPDFLADAHKLGLEVSPVSGKELSNFVDSLYGSPKEVISMVKTFIGGKAH